MKKLFLLASLFLVLHASAQQKEELAIRNILSNQITYWNQGNIPSFMEGYWNSDSLVFVGKNGPTYGFQNTLHNYQKNYPDTSYMGHLDFTIISLQALNKDHYFVIGKWQLNRAVGNVGGHFTLLFKKINGQWKIIADHSS